MPDAYLLAMVQVCTDGREHDEICYLTRAYGRDVRLPFGTTSTTLGWAPYWQRGAAQR